MSTSCYVVKAGVQAVAHGAFQGMMSAATGGSFWTGFAAGAISSIAASAWTGGDPSQCEWQGLGGKFADSGIGMIAFGTVAGGAGAQLTGGNFWVGAATGLVVSACNHAMHKIEDRRDLITRLRQAGYNPNDLATLPDSELASFAQKVLPELYAEAHSPQFESREILVTGEGFADGQTQGGEFDAVSGKGSVTKPILLSRDTAFSSYLKLASTMGHELNHVADYYNGNNAKWFNIGGKGYRKAMSEEKAYNWQFNAVGAPVNYEMYNYYQNASMLYSKLLNQH